MNAPSSTAPAPLTYKRIFSFWYPMALTWLMISIEGPFLAAIVARLQSPTDNLAAHGVAYSIAIILEAPVIMILSAATALVADLPSFLKLRRFTAVLNWSITVLMALLLVSGAMYHMVHSWIGLPEHVAELVQGALYILLPWPAAIGYRRFYQGLLIRDGKTRLVAAGTVIRLAAMGSTGLVLYLFFDLPGAYVSATALCAGVIGEAFAARLMARHSVRALFQSTPAPEEHLTGDLSYRDIIRFYYPLALTSFLSLVVHPMVSFFLGQSRFALESLAVMPVIHGLTFIFRALGLSFQEVAIALLKEHPAHRGHLTRFMFALATTSTLGLLLVAATPLAHTWFVQLSGLSVELGQFAIPPTLVLAVFPFLSVLLSYQRAILVVSKDTRPITFATVIEVTGIALVLWLTISAWDWVGALAACTALLVGRLGCNLFLVRPCLAPRTR